MLLMLESSLTEIVYGQQENELLCINIASEIRVNMKYYIVSAHVYEFNKLYRYNYGGFFVRTHPFNVRSLSCSDQVIYETN